MEWSIGNVKIDNQVVLAPMAGVCNSAFRQICKEMGCGLIYAEMVSDKAITFGNQKTLDMLYMTDKERPIVQQIFGSDKNSFVEAAKYIYETMKPDIIDINMGCPVPKVAVRAQAGSALLKDVDKIYDIHDKLKNDNIYVIEYFTSDDPPMSMVFFDKNPFKYIIFYDNKFTDLIESNTPKDVKDELCNIIK